MAGDDARALLADDLLAYQQGIEDAALERLSDEEHRSSSLLWQSTSSAVSLPSMPSLLPSRSATVEDGEEERMMREGEERLRKLDSLWQQLNVQLHDQEKLLESHERSRVEWHSVVGHVDSRTSRAGYPSATYMVPGLRVIQNQGL